MELKDVKTYEELIQCVKEDYKNKARNNGKIELTWCDDCQEINLWTYWQGYGYAKSTPEIKYLVLGQDWGNPADLSVDGGAFINIQKMNKAENVQYLDGCNLNSGKCKTVKSLLELFKIVGYDDINKKRYPELFFANFCLGYRTGNISEGMTASIMNEDAQYIKKLIEILQPQNILCLGEHVSTAIFKLLKIQTQRGATNYNDFVDKNMQKKGYPYAASDFTCKIFPLFHPGARGMNNRIGGFAQHKIDWDIIPKK